MCWLWVLCFVLVFYRIVHAVRNTQQLMMTVAVMAVMAVVAVALPHNVLHVEKLLGNHGLKDGSVFIINALGE
jgi:hypothetical protein